MSTEIPKKRILLPKLNKVITALAALSGDIAKLEISDNEQASKRVRKGLIDIKNVDFKDLQDEVTNIRIDMNVGKGRKTVRPKKQTLPVEGSNEESANK